MKIKKVWAGLLLLGAVVATACNDNGEAQAQQHIEKAQAALKSGNFNEAKLQIDSIRSQYPKAFEARKQGIGLMQQVDLAEQQHSLAYLDSMLTVQTQLVTNAKEGLVLDASVPRGYVLLTYQQIPLGFVKNIGNRANNLYPQEWRIRSGYLPEEVVCVY